MRFVKYHGCGNDALLFESAEWERVAGATGQRACADIVRQVCHRTMGVGADVVLVLAPARAGVQADARMIIFNSDGHEAQMCSTGVRAVVKYLHERRGLIKSVYRIETGRGVLEVRADVRAGAVCSATIEMGEPIFEPERIPVRLPGVDAIDVAIPPALRNVLTGPCCATIAERMSVVSTGNPHVVFACRAVDAIPLALLGPAIERHELFPQRVNVHFVERIAPNRVRMRSWERGAGATLACGTGACAVVAAGVRTGRLEREVRVDVPGGSFEISWRESTNQLVLSGPIVEVCSGVYQDASHSVQESPPDLTVLTTPRLVLRAFRTSDARRVSEIAGDRRVAETTLTIPHPYTEQDALAFFARQSELHRASGSSVYAITLRTPSGTGDGELIGAVGLMIDRNHRRGELGYWIGVEHWNQGYATEAARALAHHGFAELGLERIHASFFHANPASGRIMQKIGMKHEGTSRRHVFRFGVWHDSVHYGVLRDEFLTGEGGAIPA